MTQRVSLSVWLPTDAHVQLAAVAASEGVSLPVLARRAAARAVTAADGRGTMPAPSVEAVQELRAAGHELNRLIPALGAATTDAQEAAVAVRVGTALDRVAAAATGARVEVPARCAYRIERGDVSERERWRLVRVTTDPGTAQWWAQAARAAGFRSTANWVRDALAGAHELAVARPPTAVTTEARAVAGRVLGLLAQTETTIATRQHLGVVLGGRVEEAEAAVWMGLQSLLAHGGHPKARW